jgi:hypothetical protein
LDIGPIQQRVVLAVLVPRSPGPVGRQDIADAVWKAAPPWTGVASRVSLLAGTVGLEEFDRNPLPDILMQPALDDAWPEVGGWTRMVDVAPTVKHRLETG